MRNVQIESGVILFDAFPLASIGHNQLDALRYVHYVGVPHRF